MTKKNTDFNSPSGVDRYLADLLARMVPQSSEAFLLSAQFLSAATREGHVCLDLLSGSPWWRFLEEEGMKPKETLEEIKNSTLVGFSEESNRPFVFSGGRLYFQRYFRAEMSVAEKLLEKAKSCSLPAVDGVRRVLDCYFPDKSPPATLDMQKFAAFVAARNELCVITGGPGTGKTTTVCKILSCLCELSTEIPEILLAAPTGKAASRLALAISEEKLRLHEQTGQIFDAIPEKALTLHRILRTSLAGRSLHRKREFLSADIIVVDEASMVDLFLVDRLLNAMKPGAKLLLLGDRFQLASVSPGAVLGEICRGGGFHRSEMFLADFERVFGENASLERASDFRPMADCLVELSRSWRFKKDGGIGLFAGFLNAGKGKAAKDFLEKSCSDYRKIPAKLPELSFYPLEGKSGIKALLRPFILQFLAPYLRAESPEEAFRHFISFGLLSFLRKGPSGVEALNVLVAEILSESGLIEPHEPWYAGKPVMVVQNDPATGLFNGDVGLCLEGEDVPGQGRERKVFFPDEAGSFRTFSPSRLPRVEEVFCMTVHKSQGSEWDTLFLILPDKNSPILTREALYTGVTRAKKHLILAGNPESLEEGTGKSLFRASGLGDFLWGA